MLDRIKKSLFLKQFIIYMLVLLFSFVLLGVVFTNVFKAYYMSQKTQQLIQQAERISEQYALSIYTGVIDIQKINREFGILSDNLGASALLVAKNGRIRFASSDIDRNWIGTFVNEESLIKAINGETVVTEQFSSVFSDGALTIVYPIKAEEDVFAALIMNVSVPGVREQLISVYMIIFSVLALCGVVSFIALYLSVKRITKPLIEINKAARIISAGDFEKRIETDLTDEIGQLAQSFNEMAESLNMLEQNKRRFISNISHDIRSPLTSIQGFVTAMLDGTAEPESFSRYLKIVRDESGRIVKLANAMLDLNMLDEGRTALNLQNFDINALIRKCAEKAENAAKERGIELELVFSEEQTFVEADSEKIERALENLLENAIKFTEAGKITIETKNTDEKVRISVEDTGTGLTEDEIKHIFDRFYKADGARGKNGSGLGLSIVREFLKAHGETVSVSSEKGRGSVFSFELQKILL